MPAIIHGFCVSYTSFFILYNLVVNVTVINIWIVTIIEIFWQVTLAHVQPTQAVDVVFHINGDGVPVPQS